MSDAILTINAGSSSLKCRLVRADAPAENLGDLRVTGLGEAPVLSVAGKDTALDPNMDHRAALHHVLQRVDVMPGLKLTAVGHRIVHGGPDHVQPERITPALLDTLDRLTPLAPLHMPHNLAPARALMADRPDLPQVACFDTAFHATMPALATHFALPEHFYQEGVRRYGFHGLSYEWVAQDLAQNHPDLSHGRVVVAHLGNGASACALKAGKSVDTSMGMTALDGLMMGTRSGSIDPGVVLYLIRQKGMTADAVDRLLSTGAGLKGVSGRSHDVRRLRESHDTAAAFALDMFADRAAKWIAALTISLGGLDGLVFTGGIGENDTEMRAAITDRLAHLAPFRALTIPTNEEAMIAHHTAGML
ncbi:acetate/propionate family kinase [Yunchengibacter salinarum]|uniref:acetate/propionate family kinase n=1 Tax=Yunchengibacter salinarum TaxID=3133399 RepID=UPI0035B675DA